MHTPFARRLARLVAVAGSVIVGAAGVAYATNAATHVATTTIQACKKGNGDLRVVADPSDCRHNEQLLSWNVQGPAGPAGPAGAKGDTGAIGPAGAKGDTGAAGPAGAAGAKGDTGATGPAGAKGDTGASGPAGAAGAQGDPGAAGAPGATGATGDTGATGPAGAKGDTGAVGPAGPIGPTGPAGTDPAITAFAGLFGNNTGLAQAGHGTECTLGEISLTASTVANGVPANGQLLPISQNTALFSLLGTTYGGNGVTTFALPDLRKVAPNNMSYVICIVGVFPARF